MEKSDEVLEVISCSLKRLEEQHVNEYIAKRMEDPYYRDVLQGMYMAMALGFCQLANKLERNM